jgi:hypothetical protein
MRVPATSRMSRQCLRIVSRNGASANSLFLFNSLNRGVSMIRSRMMRPTAISRPLK